MGQVVAYKKLKTIEILKPSLQKVVAASYGRWSFTRVWDPKYRAIYGNTLVFWIGARLWEVVALEIGLYNKIKSVFSHFAAIQCWAN